MESRKKSSHPQIKKSRSRRHRPVHLQARALGTDSPGMGAHRSSPGQGQEKGRREESQVRAFSDADIRAMEGEGNERKFILSFSSEEPYERFWGREILDHSPDAVDLTRLGSIGVLLYNHKRDEVIGKVCRTWLEGQRGMAEVEFDRDEASEVVFQKVKSGTLKGVSIGYRISVIEEVRPGAVSTDGRFQGPCDVARRWMPYEISIVSVPADATVGVGRDLGPQDIPDPSGTLTCFEAQLQINRNKEVCI